MTDTTYVRYRAVTRFRYGAITALEMCKRPIVAAVTNRSADGSHVELGQRMENGTYIAKLSELVECDPSNPALPCPCCDSEAAYTEARPEHPERVECPACGLLMTGPQALQRWNRRMGIQT